MAVDFSEKIQITNPAGFYLGRFIVITGIIVLAVGLVTMYTGDILLPALAWCALSIPALGIGAILIAVSETKI